MIAAAHHTLASIQGLASEVRWHAVRGAAHAAHASEAQSHGPGFYSSCGNEGLGEQADNAKAHELHWKPLSWLGTIRPTTPNDAWDQPLWETFVCTTLGLEVPVLTSLPRRNQRAPALCGCKKHGIDTYDDHTATCTAHSGATKAHDWAVGVLGPLFRTAGHTVRSQHQVTTSAGQRRGDVEVWHYLHDAAGSRILVFDLSITHDRIGGSCHVQQNGLLTHPQDLNASLRLAAQRKINSYRQQYDNQNLLTIRTFLFSRHHKHIHPLLLYFKCVLSQCYCTSSAC